MCQLFLDPCGICHLPSAIEEGVVDGHLKVHGVKNLRIIEASIIPSHTRLPDPVYVVGEKLALGDAQTLVLIISCMNIGC
jgi:choline dehydrogenase